MDFLVSWEIDIEAASRREAAKLARGIQLNPDSHATVYKVTDAYGTISIDLEDPEEPSEGSDITATSVEQLTEVATELLEALRGLKEEVQAMHNSPNIYFTETAQRAVDKALNLAGAAITKATT